MSDSDNAVDESSEDEAAVAACEDAKNEAKRTTRTDVADEGVSRPASRKKRRKRKEDVITFCTTDCAQTFLLM